MDAHQVLVLLNELFCEFDEAVEKYGLYKVETVGDACKFAHSSFPSTRP
jgi:hypothetical protein